MPSPGAASHPGPFQATGWRHLLIPSLCLDRSVAYHTYSRLRSTQSSFAAERIAIFRELCPEPRGGTSVLFEDTYRADVQT